VQHTGHPPEASPEAAFAELESLYGGPHPTLSLVFQELSDEEVMTALPALREFGWLSPFDFGPLMAWAVTEPEPGVLVAGEGGLAYCTNSAPREALLWQRSMLAGHRETGDGLVEVDIDDGGLRMQTEAFRLVEDENEMLQGVLELMKTFHGRRKLRQAFDEWLEESSPDDTA
jgi:hypothetical protein